ncbi:MAG: DUF1848 family protein [Candidatus Aminicenantes bacterium]|nr:DUF1848 family protein [Candidatus Aminicenantes bacterium]
MKKVISASRRTDLVAFFSAWLSSVLQQKSAQVIGPSNHIYGVDLDPDHVHTLVLWSKNFSPLIENRKGLLVAVRKFAQIYLHFTITGNGGTLIEPGVPTWEYAVSQLDSLIKIAGCPERISIRFDPVLFWTENQKSRTNLYFFEKLSRELYPRGLSRVHFSFAQWYRKARIRAEKRGFNYYDPPVEEKMKYAGYLSEVAARSQIQLYVCSQDVFAEVPGIKPSACIDGDLLQRLHPEKEPASINKDKSQRKECHCTESIDIGSYKLSCPHACVYCYANPRLGGS